MDQKMMAYGAILVGILIALNTALAWPMNLNYLWAILVLAWGLMELKA